MPPVFRFVQVELPWELGPADGRYVLRDDGRGAPTHVLVVATLGAPERRLLGGRRARSREAAPEPPPAPVPTTRVTVVEAERTTVADAEAWLRRADVDAAEAALAPLARLVRAHRVASADPAAPLPRLSQALVVRVGYGAGEEVADGRWTAARELATDRDERRRRRSHVLRPQERLAALLGGRSAALACEELALRARHDLDHGDLRAGAPQLRAALDAALAELPASPQAAGLAERLDELRGLRDGVLAAADDALAGVVAPDAPERLEHALRRLEAALRARTAADAL